jgi:hypothetical protein
MDHIAEWKRIKADREQQDKTEHSKKETEKKRRTNKIKKWLAVHGAENVFTNGYVYDFDYKGMHGHFCDQSTRIIGSIHRPFFSDEDATCFRDMEIDMMRDMAIYFIMEYCYQHFCIYGKPWRSLKKVLRMIESVIVVRRRPEFP